MDDFRSATAVLRQNSKLHVRPVEGICYGPSRITDLGSRIQLIGHDFWYDISGWKGTAEAVLSVVGKHAGNGFAELREDFLGRVVEFLRSMGAITETGRVRWNALLGLVMRAKE